MLFQIRLKPSAEKEYNKIKKKDRIRIAIALIKISKNPLLGKKLEGRYKNERSCRFGAFRIIYRIYNKELLVLVIKIGSRQGAYK